MDVKDFFYEDVMYVPPQKQRNLRWIWRNFSFVDNMSTLVGLFD